MVSIPCPWCDELELLSLAEVKDPENPFTCSSCGTCVAVVDEPARLPELPVWLSDRAA